MANLDTSAEADVTTQSEASGETEIKVSSTTAPCELASGAHFSAGSVPSGLPELMELEGYGHVFRIGGSLQSGRVTITIDTNQVAERAAVRKINKAIRRARRQ